MRDRSEQILRIACLALGALVLLEVVRAGLRVSQLAGVKIPAVPTLETNAIAAAGPASGPQVQGTNRPAVIAVQTNQSISTNSVAAKSTAGTNSAATNSVAAQSASETNSLATNIVAQTSTNSTTTGATTNGLTVEATTNPAAISSSNLLAATTNSLTAAATNDAVASTNNTAAAGTNAAVAGASKASRKHPPGARGMMRGTPGNEPGLPPEIQARVDKIVNSEIFAPVMHPLPMGLLGIAGDTAFLRTADGQTGLIRAGDSLGDLKLLQIGVNRVLVDQDGQKKELLIFDGYGGDSLLSNQDETLK